jgi:hypothetical protein
MISMTDEQVRIWKDAVVSYQSHMEGKAVKVSIPKLGSRSRTRRLTLDWAVIRYVCPFPSWDHKLPSVNVVCVRKEVSYVGLCALEYGETSWDACSRSRGTNCTNETMSLLSNSDF